ncbi:MAG TPA: NUDIX hydrolase [Polyangiales bacterium]|nr:NUDIX hydrolase [Polyangiales bacterium]
MLPRWKKLTSELVHENPWWRYRKDEFEREQGQRGEYHYASSYGSAMVIPITAQGELVLVEQYRYLLDKTSLEFPGGGLGKGEPPLVAAERELAEECCSAGQLELIGTFNPWNGVTDEICHVYLADPIVPDQSGARPDATESFIVHRLSRAEYEAQIASGRIWDGMSLAAYALFRSRFG